MSTRTDIPTADGAQQLTYRQAIAAAMADELDSDPAVVVMGEDVGAAGGVFKTSEGLFERFGPQRVIDTPICENGFLGVALGMAVTGMRPIVEIMFSDFLPTAGDVIVNELPKFRFMSGGQCSVPVTVRSIGGGGGRFGTQHSATGESWYLQLPGLVVGTLGSPATAYSAIRAAVRHDSPVLLFEHKSLYNRKGEVRRAGARAVIGRAQVVRSGRDVTVVATLLMQDRALAAATKLAEEGIEAEVIDPVWLRPFDDDTVRESVGRTGRLVVAGEEVRDGSWGASLVARLAVDDAPWREPPVMIHLPDDLLIPYSPSLEDAVLPSVDRIVAAVRETCA